jgi:hypothetical protein
VGEATRQKATGKVKMVAAAVGGKGNENRTLEMSTLEGRYDNNAQRTRVRFDPSGALRAGAGGLTAMIGGPVEMIQIGETGYLQTTSTGGRWTRSEGAAASALRPIFDMFKVDDVDGFMKALACAGPVQDAGHEPVDGVGTNHYRVEAPAPRLKECIEQNDNAGSLLANLGDAKEAKVDVWVDDAALVRRITVTADSGALGKEVAAKYPGTTSVLTMSLTGFGEPVDIQAPPAAQVTDGSSLDSLLGGSGGTGDLDLGDLEDLLGGLGG